MNRPYPPENIPCPSAATVDLPRLADDGPPRWKIALWSVIGFWSVYFLIATARAAVSHMPAQDEMLLRRFCVTLIAIGMTWGLYLLLARFERLSTLRLLTLSFAASVPLAIAYATVNYIAFYNFPIAEHYIDSAMKYDAAMMDPVAVIFSSALEWYFFIAAWAVMGVALIASGKARDAERQAASFARAASDAELRALRYQVNPHFLFNTLNSLSSLVMRDRAEEAERMILNLSTFFRASLTRDAKEDVTLAEEIRLQLLYLDIERIRFPERLVVKVDVPPALDDALVPALILQPIVENAIKYGVSRSPRPVTVRIAADAIAERLELSVSDDAEPARTVDIEGSDGCGVGLVNVRARLAARFGAEASMAAGSTASGGWTVRLLMPLVRA